MKDKLIQFISNLNGQFVEVSDATNKYQCMDLAYNWVFALGIPKSTIQHLHASDVYLAADDNTRHYFDLIQNTPTAIPQAGDLVVWKPDHIAIATGDGDTTNFMCFEQNKPLGTNAHVATEKYTNVLGFLRPKEAPPMPDPKLAELQGEISQWQQHFDDLKDHLRPAGIVMGDDFPTVIGKIDGLIANQPKQGEEILKIPKDHEPLFRIGNISICIIKEVKNDG